MHHTSPMFWACYDELPPEVRAAADRSYALLRQNPQHPSLHFKRIDRFWSVRATRGYRALGVDVPDGILWFWIGPHAEYERILARG